MPERSPLSPHLPGTPGSEASRAGPPPVQIESFHFDRPPPAFAAHHRADRGTTRGFAVSALLHATLFLAMLLAMAPIAGSVGQITLLLTASQTQHELEMTRSVEIAAVPQPAAAPQLDASAQLPDDLLAMPAARPSGSDSGGGAEAGAGHGSSFFGTEAAGRDFVYVVDISGSMRSRGGERLDRAKQELIRSVDRLTDDQRFYVYAFNGSTHPMFGDRKNQGNLIRATSENKQRLYQWVQNLESSGSTDPRMAIHLGLSLAPDALFLLSDGEFRTQSNRASEWPRNDDRVSDVVLGFGTGRIPIHTISYEDQQNQSVMREIAWLTGGNHTFVPSPGKGAITTTSPSGEQTEIANVSLAALEPLSSVPDPFGADARRRSSRSHVARADRDNSKRPRLRQPSSRRTPPAMRTAAARVTAPTAMGVEQARYDLAVARAMLNVGRRREAEEMLASLDGLQLPPDLEKLRDGLEQRILSDRGKSVR